MTHSANNTTANVLDTANVLEEHIDRHGLLHVLIGLELVCGEKASHIRENWQDRAAARVWDKASNEIGELARKLSALNI